MNGSSGSGCERMGAVQKAFGVPGQRLGFLTEHGSDGAERKLKF